MVHSGKYFVVFCYNIDMKGKTEKAIFASGCFWGTEYFLGQEKGVLGTTVGYTGGEIEDPTYEQVSTGKTGHVESVEVVFDPQKVTYEQLAKIFFETHDPTQINRQGPDIGSQYKSVIFYTNEKQKNIAEKLIGILKDKGMDVATGVRKAGIFWPAEDYHQDYYQKSSYSPSCHIRRKLF